jgi:superfamily II DNA/RNA helicase
VLVDFLFLSKMDNFLNLGISKEILLNLKSLNLVKPTPVQQRAIIPGFEGKDILAIANTGTGKTAAFGIPIIQRLNENKILSALILSPTRELSIQIGKHLRDLMGKNINIKSAVLIGGDSMKKQIELIKKKPRIIIGTPGRIYDHINRKTLNLKSINILVLDETDRMLDLGFIQQIQKIINFLPSKKQTLLFSATLPKNIRNISAKYLFNPVNISVEKKEKILQNINHDTLNINQGEKYNKLLQELDTREGSIIVFMKTKHSSKKIYLKLLKDGQSVNTIHGNIRQNKRINILNKFRNQKFRVLVATDIAARGLDIPHIEHVINYDLPQRTEDYIHRIGRTARAGKKGSALSFISESDKKIWKMISKLINPNIVDKENFRKKSKTPKSKNKMLKFKKNGLVSSKKKKNRKKKSKDFTKKKVH